MMLLTSSRGHEPLTLAGLKRLKADVEPGESHDAVLRTVLDEFEAKELVPHDLMIHAAKKGKALAASWGIELPEAPSDLKLAAGLTNDIGAVRLYGGVREGNVGISLDSWEITSHRGDWISRLSLLTKEAVNDYVRVVGNYPTMIARLKSREINPRLAETLLMRAGREPAPWNDDPGPLLPWSRVGVADASFRHGPEQTAWGLLVAFAKASKQSPTLRQMAMTSTFASWLR